MIAVLLLLLPPLLLIVMMMRPLPLPPPLALLLMPDPVDVKQLCVAVHAWQFGSSSKCMVDSDGSSVGTMNNPFLNFILGMNPSVKFSGVPSKGSTTLAAQLILFALGTAQCRRSLCKSGRACVRGLEKGRVGLS